MRVSTKASASTRLSGRANIAALRVCIARRTSSIASRQPPAVPAPRDRMAPALLILLAIGWPGFALVVATDGFARAPAPADWPALIATIATPLPLLAVLWQAWRRSGRWGPP